MADYPECPICGDVGHLGCADALISEHYELRAEIEEMRDTWVCAQAKAIGDSFLARAETAESRLAAVEALCDDPVCDQEYDIWWKRKIRAAISAGSGAARGEGDRG